MKIIGVVVVVVDAAGRDQAVVAVVGMAVAALQAEAWTHWDGLPHAILRKRCPTCSWKP
jgi:hypothetical protein